MFPAASAKMQPRIEPVGSALKSSAGRNDAKGDGAVYNWLRNGVIN